MEILVENLSFDYVSDLFGNRTALSDISFQIRNNQIIAIMGSTGSGKTTLLQHFNGLLQPTRGKIIINNNILNSDDSINTVPGKIGIVFQFPEMQFFEENVFKDVAYGPQNLGLHSKEVEKRVKGSLNAVGLEYEYFHNKSPFHLSSGEKRRLAIASILALDPEILILDEPTIGLDWLSSKRIEKIIVDFHKKGRSVIFVTHNMNFVARIAEQIIVLDQGRVVYNGSKKEFFQNRKFLKKYHLPFPDIMKFMNKLKDYGIPVDNSVYTLEEAQKELDKVLMDKKFRKILKKHLFLSG
ncbi:MAG: ATP-binding cassette domain-containing protein [bacterium]